jgi:hypothetical protein
MSGPSARADLWPIKHTIPRETPAMDFRTGDVMMAPPIPYGEYVKDYPGAVHGAVGMAAGAAHSALGAAHGLIGKVCGLCGGSACGSCGGLGHHNGNACGGCGGDGCTRCDGHGRSLITHGGGHGNGHAGHAHTMPASSNGGGHTGLLGGLLGKHKGHAGVSTVGLGEHSLCGPGMPCASGQGTPSGQGGMPSGQFAMACGGCGGRGLLGNGSACGGCGGRGLLSGLACGGCGGRGLLGNGSACGGCGGRGLLGAGNACNGCGGSGHLANGNKCGLCGGTGLCAAALGKAKHVAGTAAGLAHGLLGKITHKGEIEYFVGPGGPVPLTPGYVPYVVPTRSPRDYFAFPPFSEQSQP